MRSCKVGVGWVEYVFVCRSSTSVKTNVGRKLFGSNFAPALCERTDNSRDGTINVEFLCFDSHCPISHWMWTRARLVSFREADMARRVLELSRNGGTTANVQRCRTTESKQNCP